MSYGLTLVNNSGGLTLSSDGRVYGYLGRATHVQTIQPPGPMSGTLGWPSLADCGYSVYTFNWAGPIVVALPVKTNGSTAVLEMFQTGSTWTIHVHKGTGVTNAIGFDMQEVTEVYVFGMPTAATGFGVAVYNSAGNLTGDLSRKPFTFDRFLAFPASVGSASFSGLTVPAVVGMPHWAQYTALAYDDTFNDNRLYYGAWRWNSASGLLLRQTFLWTYERSEDFWGGANTLPATTAIVIEANGLT
jgi:hypothetical protein